MKKYDKTTHQGATVDQYTLAALKHAEQLYGDTFSITQGSYNSSVGASAGTHDGGGTLDLSTKGMSGPQKAKAVRSLRRAGFAAWLRTPDQGPWPEHIHAVQLGNAKLSAGAKQQVAAYEAGRNGLANYGPDDGPTVAYPEPFDWRAWRRSQRKAKKKTNRDHAKESQQALARMKGNATFKAKRRGVFAWLRQWNNPANKK